MTDLRSKINTLQSELQQKNLFSCLLGILVFTTSCGLGYFFSYNNPNTNFYRKPQRLISSKQQPLLQTNCNEQLLLYEPLCSPLSKNRFVLNAFNNLKNSKWKLEQQYSNQQRKNNDRIINQKKQLKKAKERQLKAELTSWYKIILGILFGTSISFLYKKVQNSLTKDTLSDSGNSFLKETQLRKDKLEKPQQNNDNQKQQIEIHAKKVPKLLDNSQNLIQEQQNSRMKDLENEVSTLRTQLQNSEKLNQKISKDLKIKHKELKSSNLIRQSTELSPNNPKSNLSDNIFFIFVGCISSIVIYLIVLFR